MNSIVTANQKIVAEKDEKCPHAAQTRMMLNMARLQRSDFLNRVHFERALAQNTLQWIAPCGCDSYDFWYFLPNVPHLFALHFGYEEIESNIGSQFLVDYHRAQMALALTDAQDPELYDRDTMHWPAMEPRTNMSNSRTVKVGLTTLTVFIILATLFAMFYFLIFK